MSRRLFSCLAAIFLVIPWLAHAEDALSAGMNGFGERLLGQMAAKTGAASNIMVSPYSVSSALSMAMLGSAGQTRAEMESVLQLPPEWADEEARLGKTLEDEPEVTLSVANGIWGAREIRFGQSFASEARRIFAAEMESVDFSDPAALGRINGWVSDATRGMIPNLIDRLEPDLAAVLVNALYFKGEWRDAFDADMTSNEDFHLADGRIKPVAMMHKRADFGYAATEGWQAVVLPYRGDGFDLMVVLPEAEGSVLDSLHEAMGARFRRHKGFLGLPKVDLSASSELAKTLEDMGMQAAFSPAADFSRMCDQGTHISRVIHKVAMKMDEKGTEAAAATAVMMTKSMSMAEDRPFRMIVDHPYGIVLRHRASGAILFMGIVADPV